MARGFGPGGPGAEGATTYLGYFDRIANVSIAWTTTRLGQAALQQSGAVERVLAGGSL